MSGGPDEHPQECPPDAARSRAHGQHGSRRADAEGRRVSRRRLPAHGAQMGRALSSAKAWPDCRTAARGPQRLYRPTPHSRSIERIEALRRQRLTGKADRRRDRRLAGHREPRPQAPGPQQAERPGAGRAGAPLRARTAWRTDPHRHQEARQVRPDRPSHHRRSNRPKQRRRGVGWEFVHVCIDDCLAHRLQPDHARRDASEAPSPSSRPPSPTMQASASPSSAS